MIAICIVISRVHDNFNLGIVALGVGTLVASFVIIMETENIDFVHIYVDAKRFIVRTLTETKTGSLCLLDNGLIVQNRLR